jgi:hypothetical protein
MADNIQAILFDKLYWNTNDARIYLKESNKKPIKRVHITDNYYRYRLIEPDYDNYYYIFKKGNNHIDYIIQLPIKDNKGQPKPRDPILYNKIKKEMSEKYKHSAYRSGLIVKEYKKEYYKKYKTNDAYIGEKPELSNLQRWFKENWRSDSGNIGYKYKDDIYRPTIRVNKYTPITYDELSKSQIERAKKEKKLTGRVKKFNVHSF